MTCSTRICIVALFAAIIWIDACNALSAAPSGASTSTSGSIRQTASQINQNSLFTPTRAGTSALMPMISDPGDVVGRVFSFLNLGLNYSMQYGDQLPIARGRGGKSTVHQLSPEAYITFAERLTVFYRPTLNWYTSDTLNDNVSHVFSARTGAMIGSTNLSLAQSYYLTEDPIFETGQQTREEGFGTTIAATRPLAEKVTIDGSVSRQTRRTEIFADLESWNVFVWLRRSQQHGLDLSAGAGATYNIISPGANSYSQQLLGKIRRQVGDRINIQIEAGLDVSSFSGNSRKNISNAVYGADIKYQLFEPTTLFVGARRAMMPTYYSGQLVLTTRYNLGLNQRLFGRFLFHAGVSHLSSDYISGGPLMGGSNEGRGDDYLEYTANLSTQLFQRLSTSLMWRHSENRSNLGGFTYEGTLIGVSLGVKF